MNKSRTILVVPGLGGPRSIKMVKWLVKRWEDSDTKVIVFESRWNSDETSKEKLDRLKELADKNVSSENDLSVVAYSAGGALAVSGLTTNRKLSTLTLVSAKLKGWQGIGPKYQKDAPALREIVKASQQVIEDIGHIQDISMTCLVPWYDEVVRKQDMIIDGATRITIPSVFHSLSIAVALIFKVPRVLKKT